MTDVGQWLAGIGLDRYAATFEASEIRADVLVDLTDADLQQLGIPLGDRKRLLKAIASLAAQPAGAGLAEAAILPAWSAPAKRAERRQLTVMFVDLVGSTALSRRLDPEEMGEVLRAYQNTVAAEVTRFEGHVANFMGDGVLAYFGWPAAHEDDAERAVRAGLAVTLAVARLAAPAGRPLAARVGIATGLVVVGELIGEGAAQEESVVGETPNLAARLQALAPPGGVAIAENTRRLLGRLFELDDLGDLALKGFDRAQRAFRVRGTGAAEGRFAALRAAGVTPLVGREQELMLLLEGWRRAKAGTGQVVHVVGEPGIGKSRVVLALRERLRQEPCLRLSYHCSPHHTHSALYPVIEQLARAAGFSREDAADARIAKLEAMLCEATPDAEEAVPVIAALLAVPTDGRYAQLALTPQEQKTRTFKTLLNQLDGLAAQKPVVMILEDAHWLDPTSLELFGLMVDRLVRLPVLLIVTLRAEITPPWVGRTHVTTLVLTRLGRRDATALVEHVAGGKLLPVEILDQILARTDGVPLFVEELTKAVLESGLLREEATGYALTGPLPPFAIPSTLQDSLMARLDRLAPTKEIAQIGAVIGREFGHELLAAVAELPEARLGAALDQLLASELVFGRGEPPQASYSFKHALVRDAAYQSLLKSRRQQLHARVAQVLETRFPEVAEAQPEVLAQHCTEAGLIEKAVAYWHKAGQLAIHRSAVAEGVAQLTTGLEMLQGLADSPERRRRELGLQVALGNALTATRGWAAPEVGRAYARARELCRDGADATQLSRVLWGLYAYNLHGGNASMADEAAEEMLRLAEQQQDPAAQVAAHRALGGRLMWRGQLSPALGHLERALALYDRADRQALMLLGVSDARVLCLGFTACILSWQGCPDQALARSEESLAAAHEAGQAHTLSHGLFLSCWFHQIRGEPQIVRERSTALVALTAEHGFRGWLAEGTFYQGWALAAEGDVASGLPLMRDGLAAIRAAGMRMEVPMYLCLLAGMCTKAGQPSEALELLTEALDQAGTAEGRWFEAELHRLRGEALLALSSEGTAEAETCWRRAIAIAREQGARLWELRAARDLARCWAEQGEQRKARSLLAPIYGRFTEGLDMPDLIEAKVLLEALA